MAEDEKVKAKLHQTQLGVNAIVAGIAGVGGYDEQTGLYYPFPKEILYLVERILPGEVKKLDCSVTVEANTTTATKEITVDDGQVFYIYGIGIIGSPPSGKISVYIDDTPVIKDANLSATTFDIAGANGLPFRGYKIKVTVVLDSAPSSDTTVGIEASVIQKKDLTQ